MKYATKLALGTLVLSALLSARVAPQVIVTPRAPSSPASTSPQLPQGRSALNPQSLQARSYTSYERAKSAIEQHCKLTLSSEVSFKYVTFDEFESAIRKEAHSFLLAAGSSAKEATEAAARIAAGSRMTAYAKYVISSKEILLCGGALLMHAAILKKPEMSESPCLEAILVHEIAHAVAFQKYEVSPTALSQSYGSTQSPLAGIVEGHAQMITRSVCAEQKWSAGFDLMTSAIGQVSAETQAAPGSEQLAERMASASIRTYYVEGERFVTALRDAKTDGLIERAFSSPPVSIAVLYSPELFIRPDLATEAAPNIARGLDWFTAHVVPRAWTSTRTVMTPDLLRATWSMLNEDAVNDLVASVRSSESTWALHTDTQERLLALTITMFESHGAAGRFVVFGEIVNRMKDDNLRLKSNLAFVEYVPFGRDREFGFVATKQFQGLGSLHDAVNAVVVRDLIGIEVMGANFRFTPAELRSMVTSLLDVLSPPSVKAR